VKQCAISRAGPADPTVAALARAGGAALVSAAMGPAMHGATALYAAADAGALGAVRALLEVLRGRRVGAVLRGRRDRAVAPGCAARVRRRHSEVCRSPPRPPSPPSRNREAGADPDAALSPPSRATPLMVAVEHDDYAMTSALLRGGADHELGGGGSSLHQKPLLLAVVKNHVNAARALLEVDKQAVSSDTDCVAQS
jgi:hypothetical protein